MTPNSAAIKLKRVLAGHPGIDIVAVGCTLDPDNGKLCVIVYSTR